MGRDSIFDMLMSRKAKAAKHRNSAPGRFGVTNTSEVLRCPLSTPPSVPGGASRKNLV